MTSALTLRSSLRLHEGLVRYNPRRRCGEPRAVEAAATQPVAAVQGAQVPVRAAGAAEEEQLASVDGDTDRYDAELRRS